jgi:hypothetical protein
MLPPQLQIIKDHLDATGYARRTAAQDALLRELNDLNENASVERHLRESRVTKMTGPLGDSCPSCGRAF